MVAGAAFFSPAPALRLGSSSPAYQVPSPAPPLRLGASTSTSSAPPLGQGASSTASSAPPLGQAAASTSSSHARRFLVLEVADFPLMEGDGFSKHNIYSASEFVGATTKTLDCDDLVLFEKKKMLQTEGSVLPALCYSVQSSMIR